MSRSEVQHTLQQLKIHPSKKLGQNFLTEKRVIKTIISTSNVSQNDVVLDIGAGLGVITAELIDLVKKVYAIEVDNRLYSYLNDKFSTYRNVEIIHGDILKIDIPAHNKVISNIPYSITGPILDRIFFKPSPPEGILTLERNIANRIFFSGNYKDFSRITVGINSFMIPISKSNISKDSFYPTPRIPLTLIKIIPKIKVNSFLIEKESRTFFLQFIAGIMPFKNKNIANAISYFLENQKDMQYTKEEIILILQQNNFSNTKVFNYKPKDFIEISKCFYS
ncbi:MAG: 16S rRNA (adenine(1518)-N(6)/adenine(1519)-N(6))-dimethyltransferase RsmA [Promethearchaeota archaeon]